MISLRTGELLDLLKQSAFVDNIEVQCLSYALKCEIQKILDVSQTTMVHAGIDNLPEHILDELAKELNLNWYKADCSLSVKRAIVKSSDTVYMTLGTPEAVRQVAADFYGDAKVEEWYDYDGEPGHFRISVLEQGGSLTTPDILYTLVDKVKRAGAIMDGVDFSWENYLTVYCGVAINSVSKGSDIIVPPFSRENYLTVYSGIATGAVRIEAPIDIPPGEVPIDVQPGEAPIYVPPEEDPVVEVPIEWPKLENHLTMYVGSATHRAIREIITVEGGIEHGI